jgi:pimeloyl-ACP methyl ester carboxylesterase
MVAIGTDTFILEQDITLTLAGDMDALSALIEARVREQIATNDAPQGVEDLDAFVEGYTAQQVMLHENWLRFFYAHDPAENWAQIAVPVLALFGGLDLQVDANQNVGPMAAALEAAANEDVTVITIPTANHLFQEAITGTVMEYGELVQAFHPDFLPAITDWLLGRVTLAE